MRQKYKESLDSLSSLENNIAKLYRTNIIQPLKGFCRVVEEGNLSRAAEKYGVTPGLLTKQIKVIENQLGIELFNRDNNCRIFPNDAGLKFYDRASKIISQLENLVVEFSEEMNDEESKILRVGMSSTIVSRFVDTIVEFEKQEKDIKILFKIAQKNNLVDLLKNGKIDVVITSNDYDGNKAAFDFIELLDYTPYWVLWKGHPLECKEQLTREDLINTNLSFPYRDITCNGLRHFIDDNNIKSVVEIDNCDLETQKRFILNKFGISLIFNIFLNEQDGRNFVFKKATNLIPSNSYGCLTNKVKKPILEKFIKFLENQKDKIFNTDFLQN